MMEIRFVIKKDDTAYYAGADWRPKFSADKENADWFETYEQAEKILRAGAGEDENAYSPWFPEGIYQIEKWFIVEDSDD